MNLVITLAKVVKNFRKYKPNEEQIVLLNKHFGP